LESARIHTVVVCEERFTVALAQFRAIPCSDIGWGARLGDGGVPGLLAGVQLNNGGRAEGVGLIPAGLETLERCVLDAVGVGSEPPVDGVVDA
ncbi:hypothetical protein, partial [Xylella fastidiosa]|uniref:hypothetical protein n=1 Tax=Xylella fastidiosa TaxID=2371 RepID=UPI0015E1B98F